MAVLVNKNLPGMAFFRAAYYIPVVTSISLAAVMWDWVYNKEGTLNWALGAVHLIAQGSFFGWLNNSVFNITEAESSAVVLLTLFAAVIVRVERLSLSLEDAIRNALIVFGCFLALSAGAFVLPQIVTPRIDPPTPGLAEKGDGLIP